MTHRQVVNPGLLEGMKLGRGTRLIEVGAVVRGEEAVRDPKERERETLQEELERSGHRRDKRKQ
jgi:hypothetical protein